MVTFQLGLTGVNASNFQMGHGYNQEEEIAYKYFLYRLTDRWTCMNYIIEKLHN